MRKVIGLLVFLSFSSVFAQANLQGYWGGVSFGSPGISFHVGAEDALGAGVDLRGNLGYNYLFSRGVSIGADALFHFDTDAGAIDVYGGAGGFLALGGGFGLALQGLVGGEYRLVDAGFPEGGLFFELGPDLYLAPSVFLGFTGRVGFNYHF
jgi:hypothetical protein